MVVNFEKPEVSWLALPADRRDALRETQLEVLRLVHNFLASAKTLVDHTRVLTTELYTHTPFKDEYQAKIKELFAEAPLPRFLLGLRNWMLHKGTVPLAVVSTFEGIDSSASRLVLKLADLKMWDGWDSFAKSFLLETSSDIELKVVVRSYGRLVEAFYDWLSGRMSELHADAFKELERLQRQYQAVRPCL